MELAASILAFSAMAIIMLRVDPYQATVLEKLLFLASFLIGIGGIVITVFKKFYGHKN